MKLGQDINVTKHWLDIQYPDSPPPEYARKGIDFSDDAIEWKDEIIPHSHYIQLHHIMWPRAILAAVTISMHILYRMQLLKLKKQLGLSLSDLDKSVQGLARISRLQDQRAREKAEKADRDVLSALKAILALLRELTKSRD